MLELTTPRAAKIGALAALICLGVAAAGCGNSTTTNPPSSAPTHGTANVAYASSLDYLNTTVASPAFENATGDKYLGTSGESGTLESEIAANELPNVNVFESVGSDNITPLEPKYTKWYVQYAVNKMVVAYNPNGKYGSELSAIASGKKPLKDLFTLMETPGFKLGRTDPNTDPQGRYFVEMLELAQMYYHLPKDTVTKIVGSPLASPTSKEIYAESSLDSTLEAGELDAASAYYTQAVQLHLHYIALPDQINLGNFALASYYGKSAITTTSGGQKTVHNGKPLVMDITIIGKPTPAAIAFVKYTLSATGLAQYKTGGFTLIKPTVYGTGVPSAISSELGS